VIAFWLGKVLSVWMQTLDAEFKVQNRSLKQIRRSGMVALYELYGANKLLYGYEVVIIRRRPAEEAFGKAYPERELYPSNEEWGTRGWSYGTAQGDLALESFQRLAKEHSQ
jgi:hypothetical protein